jgi:hypothetical protein
MSKRLDKVESLWKLRGIYSDALRAASCLGEFFALGQSHTPLSQRLGTGAPLFRKRRSGYGPAIAQALGLLSSSVPYPPARRFDCPQGVAEVNQVVYLLSSNCAAISIGAA